MTFAQSGLHQHISQPACSTLLTQVSDSNAAGQIEQLGTIVGGEPASLTLDEDVVGESAYALGYVLAAELRILRGLKWH